MAAYEKQGESDEWYTPRYIFDALGLQFDLDVASPPEGPRHVPADFFHSEGSLEKTWHGLVWMNPPFGHQSTKVKWMQKFFDHGNGVALLPDRTSAPWWQEFAPLADAILFVSPKVKFEMPEGVIEHVHDLAQAGHDIDHIVANSRFSKANVNRILSGDEVIEQPGTGTTLFAAGEQATSALIRASSLGQVFQPIKRAAA